MRFAALCLAALLAPLAFPSAAQAQRPLPHPVFTPPQVARAVDAGTRTTTGVPGAAYWQNSATYRIDARLDEQAREVHAASTITYRNQSPDTLRFLVVRLNQNVHAPGVPRNRTVAVTGGMTIRTLRVGGAEVTEVERGQPEGGQYHVDGTILTLALTEPLAPGGVASLDVAWSYPVPPSTGAFRQGQDGEVYYLGYWYPQMAVYDDVYGWNTDPYLGAGEHYMGYADYDLTLDMPAGWLVWSTGELTNAAEVLTEETARRLLRARTDDAVVQVVREAERGRATRATEGRTVWHFSARNVRDVAVSASAAYVWDATRALVDQDGDGTPEPVLINAFYRPGTASWERGAEFARFSIEHLSEMLVPYPYPHMTAVEGLIGGGMEYPMMTLIGGARTDPSLFGVTYHEIAHMWHPMLVGTNERAYTWMDEGLTSFFTNEGVAAFFDGSAPNRPKVDAWARNRQAHYRLAGSGYAIEPMRHNDQFRVGGGTSQVDPVGGAARTVASYSTPAVLLHALRGMVGDERFLAAFRTYNRTWAYKHPLPTDFFNAMEAALGRDLDWLWTPTLFETWTVDQAVGAVRTAPDGSLEVVIEDLGLAPMPAPVVVTYADGTSATATVPVETWLGGATTATLSFPAGTVASIEIDPEGFIHDADRTNNTYRSAPSGG